jgi:hypothetical protein
VIDQLRDGDLERMGSKITQRERERGRKFKSLNRFQLLKTFHVTFLFIYFLFNCLFFFLIKKNILLQSIKKRRVKTKKILLIFKNIFLKTQAHNKTKNINLFLFNPPPLPPDPSPIHSLIYPPPLMIAMNSKLFLLYF